jgi:hypothetical protein
MSFNELAAFTKTVSDLADEIDTDNPSELKAAFDAAPEELRQSFNNLVKALKSTTNGDSGAKNTGATNISGLTGSDVQSLLESLKTYADTMAPKNNPFFYYKGGLWGAIAAANTLYQMPCTASMISGLHQSGNDLFVDTAGKYVLEASAIISGLAINQTFDILIRVVRNGTNADDVSSILGSGQGSTNPNPQGELNRNSIIYDLQVNDKIQFFVRASEAPRNINQYWIKGYKISN